MNLHFEKNQQFEFLSTKRYFIKLKLPESEVVFCCQAHQNKILTPNQKVSHVRTKPKKCLTFHLFLYLPFSNPNPPLPTTGSREKIFFNKKFKYFFFDIDPKTNFLGAKSWESC